MRGITAGTLFKEIGNKLVGAGFGHSPKADSKAICQGFTPYLRWKP
nr:hypothetical protein [uncultured bacterium]